MQSINEYIPPKTRIQVKTLGDRVEYTPAYWGTHSAYRSKKLLGLITYGWYEKEPCWLSLERWGGGCNLPERSEDYAKYCIDRYLYCCNQKWKQEQFEKHGEITYQEYP